MYILKTNVKSIFDNMDSIIFLNINKFWFYLIYCHIKLFRFFYFIKNNSINSWIKNLNYNSILNIEIID